MKTIADLLDSNPLTKYVVPFIRTPHNLMVYAGTYTPGINRFLKRHRLSALMMKLRRQCLRAVWLWAMESWLLAGHSLQPAT